MRVLLFVLFCWVFSTEVFGQEKERIKILKTDSLVGNTTPAGAVRRLLGRVHLQTEKATIKCDSAWHYIDQKKVDAFGNIYIKTADDELHAHRIIYDLKSETCTFLGPVNILTKNTELFATEGIYHLKTKNAVFQKPIFIRDENRMIRAHAGTFFTRQDSSRLSGAVQFRDSSIYLEADSLETGKKSGRTVASGTVFIRHFQEKWAIQSGWFQRDTLGNTMLQREVAYVKPDSASGDSTWLAATEMQVFENSEKTTLSGDKNIRVWHPDYAAAADSLFYQENTGLFYLSKDPAIWTGNRQLSGQEFTMNLKDGALETLFSTPEPFMSEPDSVSGRFNQITGDTLDIRFVKGDPEQMIWKNRVSLLFQSRKDSLSETGLVALSGSRLNILFENKKASKMTGSKDITGYFSEKPDSTAALILPGFKWTPERRPQKPATFPLPRFREALLDSLDRVNRKRIAP